LLSRRRATLEEREEEERDGRRPRSTEGPLPLPSRLLSPPIAEPGQRQGWGRQAPPRRLIQEQEQEQEQAQLLSEPAAELQGQRRARARKQAEERR
jgi:hypothetical protein